MAQEGGDDTLSQQLQPHLTTAAAPQDFPAAVVQDSDVSVSLGEDATAGTHAGNARPTWETFGDNDKTGSVPEDQAGSRGQPAVRLPPPPPRGAANSRTPPTPADISATGAATQHPGATTAELPVSYNHRSGAVKVPAAGAAVGNGGGPGADPAVIQTRHLPESGLNDMDRPLRPGRIKRLKVLSVVAAIFFLPTGLLAMHFAWKIPRQFRQGLQQGNIDRALRSARRSQQMMVLSAILFVVVAAVALAVADRWSHGDGGSKTGFVAHQSVQGRSL